MIRSAVAAVLAGVLLAVSLCTPLQVHARDSILEDMDFSGEGNPPAVMMTVQMQYNKALANALWTRKDTAEVLLRDKSEIDLSILRSIARQAEVEGVRVRFCAVTTPGLYSDFKLYFYADEADRTIRLEASTDSVTAVQVYNRFTSLYSNKLEVLHLTQPGSYGQRVRIAVKMDLSRLDMDNLVFYAYDPEENLLYDIENPSYGFDEWGYLWFSTTQAGCIIITDHALQGK